jgi:hypothetical protein
MTTKKFNLLILLLLIIGLGGCGKLVEVPDDTIPMPPLIGDPIILNKDIIGKWKLVAEEREGNQIIPVEADGYIEYLASGDIQFSSDGSGDIRKAYQIDNAYLYEYIDVVYPYFVYEYTFINEDKLKLKEVASIIFKMLYPYYRIYERIKEYTDREGTQWKLAGYADVQTGEFIIEESGENCGGCNTLEFNKDGKGTAWAIINTIEVDLSGKLIFGGRTKADDSDNGHLKLFYKAIALGGPGIVDSFEYTEKEFKFYYNNKKNYLLYKRINQ